MSHTPFIAINMSKALTSVLVLLRRGYAYKRRAYADYLTAQEMETYDVIIAAFDAELSEDWRQAEMKAHDQQQQNEGTSSC